MVNYFEQDQFVGQRKMYCCGYDQVSGPSVSAFWPHTAYFCPQCGQLWGRAIFDYQFDYSPIPRSSWVIESRPCAHCGDGQFLVGQYPEDLGPEAYDLLKREVLVLLERYHA